MSIIVTQPFNFQSIQPNFIRDYIDSRNYTNQTPLKLTAEESTALSTKYDVGHIVCDTNTKQHYSFESKIVAETTTYYFKPLEPLQATCDEWNNSSYIPKMGEIIIVTDYQYDNDGNGNMISTPVIKIGDGSTLAANLPYLGEYVKHAEIADKLSHSLKIGDIIFDGSEDKEVPIYSGEYYTEYAGEYILI